MSFHQDGDVETYLLTIMNMVSSLYLDPTIGNFINIVVVRIILIEDKDVEVSALRSVSLFRSIPRDRRETWHIPAPDAPITRALIVSVPERAQHLGQRGRHPVPFLQMATGIKSRRRLPPESSRRGDLGDEEGHLFAQEYLQHFGSGACSRHVPAGSQLQRQRG